VEFIAIKGCKFTECVANKAVSSRNSQLLNGVSSRNL
jgi:hypothetical protein